LRHLSGNSSSAYGVLYPLDDQNPKHLQANRDFFEAQIDRFKRPEARLRDVQYQAYR
jgi:hypothetical protein